jgi:hypothetical protein
MTDEEWSSETLGERDGYTILSRHTTESDGV